MAGMKGVNIEILSKLSGFAGIRYPEPENYRKWRKPVRYLWNLYADIILAAIVLEVCFLLVQMSHHPDDLGILCGCFVGAGYALHLVLKLLIFSRYRDLFVRLFDDMRKISKELCLNPFDEGYEQFHDYYYRKILKTAMIKGGLEVTAAVTLIGIFIIRSFIWGAPEDGATPAITWTPYDNTENPRYFLTCFFEMIVYGSVTLRNAAVDLLFWLMLMVPTIQLRYLNHLLEIILREPQKNQPDGSELNERFIWWVKYHQRVLSMIQEFKTITSPYLGVNYLTTLLILSLAGLVAISTSSWNIFQQAIINGIVISNTIQLYFVSLTGDWLSESSEAAAEGGFTSLLFTASKSLRRNYLFVSARTKHSLQIRFGGINRLCSENFEQLIRLTITYLVTVVQLRNDRSSTEKI